MTKTTKRMSKKSRNVIFSKSKIPTPRITQDWGGGGGHWGITHSPTHSKCSYSTPLLNPPTQGGYSRPLRNVF